MVRPSYVLGGRGMEIVHEERMLESYVRSAVGVTPERPILIDKFLENATEVETDAISDGTDVFIPAVMQHIEYAGVHSGDSACVLPPVSVSEENLATIEKYTALIAKELHVVGLMNMQYAIADGTVYVLEANPRASRTVPLVSKVCNIQMAKIATGLMNGGKLSELKLERKPVKHFGVKEAVFPFNMLPEVDPLLGPEMRSTGEVLGLAASPGMAFFKAQEAAGQTLPQEGAVLISVARRDRGGLLKVAREFDELGFSIVATEGTQKYLEENGIKAKPIQKLHEGRPNLLDLIKNREVQLIINTPAGTESEYDDSYIRKNAIKYRIPYITTLIAALAAADGIAERRNGIAEAKSLQVYHKEIEG